MNLKSRIYAQGLTQEKVSTMTAIDEGRLSKIVRGLVEATPEEVKKLEEVLEGGVEPTPGIPLDKYREAYAGRYFSRAEIEILAVLNLIAERLGKEVVNDR